MHFKNHLHLVLALGLSLLLAACSDSADAPDPNLLGQATFGGYDVTVDAARTWSNGFKGAVVLKNNSGAAVNSFEIKFKLDANNPISSSWGGAFSKPDANGTITLKSPTYFKALSAGSSFESGFVAAEAFAGASVLSLSVNGVRVGGGAAPPPTPDEPSNPTGTPVYSQTFDTQELGEYKRKEALQVENCAGKGRCLKVAYVPYERGTPRLTFREVLPPAAEYTMSYDLKFDKDFEWVRGGKLPGLAPAGSVAGCGAAVDEGWSVKLMWRAEGSFMQYLYHQDKTERCGENVYAQDFTLQKDRWYDIDIYVRVNSSANAFDGQVSLYVDEVEVARRENLRLRNSDTGGLIERLYFSTFYGGGDASWSPSKTTYIYYDNFVVYPGLRTR